MPGLAWLSAIAIATWGFDFVQRVLAAVDWPRGFLLAGTGWIWGFAVQSVGKMLPKRLRPETFPSGAFADDADYSARLVEFHSKATELNEQQLERFVTVKDATGNSYVALLLAVVTLGLDWSVESMTGPSTYPPALPWQSTVIPIASLLLAIEGLRRQHLKSSARQTSHIRAVLAHSSKSPETVHLSE